MFHLIGEYYLTADPNCYIIGKPLERRGKGIEMKSARYFTTLPAASAQPLMNYNQQSEDFSTLDRPIARKDSTVRFEDGSTMDIHEDSSLMESEIYTHVSHAMQQRGSAIRSSWKRIFLACPSKLKADFSIKKQLNFCEQDF